MPPAARRLRVAIVGSGPSGFYAAESLFRHTDVVAEVDMFDRLPSPFGLVRYGVAPDHQKMKAVIRVYEKTASHPRFRFFGNVMLGRDVTVEDLRELYDQIVYATGSETDRRLGIPGEDLAGSYGATAFVGWYNGHPDYIDHRFDLSHERAAVFGVGNVAMDVTRILLRDARELEDTDIAEPALAALRESRVREVILFGRRGPAQAAFTPKEIEEVGSLEGSDLVVRSEEIELAPAERAALEKGSNAWKNVEYLTQKAREGEGSNARKARLRFFASPVELLGEGGRLTAVKIERTTLVPDGKGGLRAKGTGEFEVIPAGLAFRSIGYDGVPLPGVPFDAKRGVIPNEGGRVLDPASGSPRPGEYVAGWAKRGPTGLIGTNRGCSADTVSLMVEDHCRGATEKPLGSPDETPNLLSARSVRFVTFEEWKRLDEIEIERGRARGKVREKILLVEDALAALDASAEGKSPAPR
jgi:ferredoxin--NADP+ reductase